MNTNGVYSNSGQSRGRSPDRVSSIPSRSSSSDSSNSRSHLIFIAPINSDGTGDYASSDDDTLNEPIDPAQLKSGKSTPPIPARYSSDSSTAPVTHDAKALEFCSQFSNENSAVNIKGWLTHCANEKSFIEQLLQAINATKEIKDETSPLIEAIKKQISYNKVLASYDELQAAAQETLPSGRKICVSDNRPRNILNDRALLFKTKARGYISIEQETKNAEDIATADQLIDSITAFLKRLQSLKSRSLSSDEQIAIYDEFLSLDNIVDEYEESVKKEALPPSFLLHIESGLFDNIMNYCVSAVSATFFFVTGAHILAFSVEMMATIPFLLHILGQVIKLTNAYVKKRQRERSLAAQPIRKQILLPLAKSLKTIMSMINIPTADIKRIINSTIDSNLAEFKEKQAKIATNTNQEVKELKGMISQFLQDPAALEEAARVAREKA